MTVRALFFATYRDIASADQMEVELPDGAAVAELVRRLRARGGQWTSLPERPAVAVNMEYSSLDAVLRPGDEVAFIPPVSGG